MARVSLALALAASLMLSLIAPFGAGAATLDVCPSGCTYSSIQAAVSAASPGDTVTVGAGTYSELVTVDKALTLRGAQAGVDARTRSGAAGTESVLNGPTTAFNITASGVTVDGFTVQNSTNANLFGAGIRLASTGSGATIQNNIVQNNLIGLQLANDGTAQTVIRYNLFQNNNQTGPASGHGIYSDEYVAGGPLSNVLIDANAFAGHAFAAIGFSQQTVGKEASDITISNNAFDQNARALYAYLLRSSAFTGNRVTNSGSYALGFFGGVDDVSLTGNTLETGTGRGIRVGDFLGIANTGIVAHYNRIVGFAQDALLIEANGYDGTLNAENNWWGCNTGPNTTGCGTASGAVDFDPWLVLSINADPTTIATAGNAGDSSSITASLTENSAGADTSAGGHVPDGTTITFGTTAGSLSSTSATTVDGVASVTLTAGSAPGSATVSASLDQQSVGASVAWEAVPTANARVFAMRPFNPLVTINTRTNGAGHASGFATVRDGQLAFSTLTIETMVVDGDQATLYGTAQIRQGRQWMATVVDFQLDVDESGGTIRLQLSNGYDSGPISVWMVNVVS